MMYCWYMPSPRTPGSTRSHLIEVTAGLLADIPAVEVTNRVICDAAGVTAPTLYHHFGDKEQLFEAVALDRFTAYLTSKQALGHLADAADDFRRGWYLHLEFALDNPTLYGILFGDLAAARASTAAESVRDELTRVIEHIETTGRLRLPIQLATDVAYAAASGLSLHLIRTHASIHDPIVQLMCDTVVATLIGPSTIPTSRAALLDTAAVSRAAAELDSALSSGPPRDLGPLETALLRQWLPTLR
jgi:AcrR family transcriptional regulator